MTQKQFDEAFEWLFSEEGEWAAATLFSQRMKKEDKKRIVGNCSSIMDDDIPTLKRAKLKDPEVYDILYDRLCKKLEVFFEGTLNIEEIEKLINEHINR